MRGEPRGLVGVRRARSGGGARAKPGGGLGCGLDGGEFRAVPGHGGRASRRPGPGSSLRGRSRRLGPCATRATLRLLLSHPRAAAPCNRVRPRSKSVSASTKAKRRLGSGTQGCLCRPGLFFLARLTAAPASPGARVRSGAQAFLPCSGGQPQAGNVTQSGWGRGVFASARVQILLCPGSDSWGLGALGQDSEVPGPPVVLVLAAGSQRKRTFNPRSSRTQTAAPLGQSPSAL